MIYDEPEPLPFAVRHWLGAALLQAKQYDAAARDYREELVHHPHNGWSLLGLQQALAGLGTPLRSGCGPGEELGARGHLDSMLRF